MNATAAQTKSLEWLNRLRANPKIPLIVAGSAAVAVMVALILWAKAPDYRTLFSNLSDQDGGACRIWEFVLWQGHYDEDKAPQSRMEEVAKTPSEDLLSQVYYCGVQHI